MNNAVRQAKRIVIAFLGFLVLGVGLAMVVLPGPAILVIPVGLGILSLEFAWAGRLLCRIRGWLTKRKYKERKDFLNK